MEPCIEGGRFPVKRIVGQELKVSADVSKNGHDQLSVVLKWRKIGKPDWHQTPMAQTENDRWEAACHFIRTHSTNTQSRHGKTLSSRGKLNTPKSMGLGTWI